jgi:hypothetical protein
MDCKQATILLAPHILGDLENEPQRCKELQAHLLFCPSCAEMYDGFKETIGFVLNHKAEFAQAFEKARAREEKSKEVLIDCKQAQFSISQLIANDPDLTDQQSTDFQAHIESCPECSREYEESKFALELTRQHRPISDETVSLTEKAGQDYKTKMIVEEGWKDLFRRNPDLAESTEKPKILQLFLRIGATAACLVIGVLSWMVFSNYSKPQALPHNPASQQVASVTKPSVKVELVTNSGNILIPSDEQITSTSQSKTLLINGKHKMMMNTNTVLAVEPLVEHDSVGCLVKLDSGRIYTHVEYDGNPFIVDTVHGQAVITGTTFDIKATEDSTTLVVSEGAVQFESEKGVVNVAAGKISKIVGQSAPSIPLSCNTAELTAWAIGYKSEPALTQAESDTDPWYLTLSFGKEPIILEETEYAHWVEKNRDWFKQEFPWTFQLKSALAQEGIEVEYPELLIQSGDVWQFVCLDVSPEQFSVIDPNSLIKTASGYGFDKLWLLENVPAVKSAPEKPVLSENSVTGLKAFERWINYLDETNELEQPTSIYPYHAGKYLAETRSLIWFAVRNGKYDLTSEESAAVLALLQKEVTAACKCQNEVLFPGDESKSSFCEDKCREAIDSVVGYIETMKGVEEKIAEYEIGK